MEIAKQDIIVSNIANIVDSKNNILINKFNELNRTKNENKFIDLIYNDYLHYYDHILNEKYKTKAALINILKHLMNIENNNLITNEQLKFAKLQQNVILSRLYNVKRELDNVTNNLN